MKLLFTGISIAFVCFGLCKGTLAEEVTLFKEIEEFVEKRELEFENIPIERKESLEQLSNYLRECQKSGRPARLIFV